MVLSQDSGSRRGRLGRLLNNPFFRVLVVGIVSILTGGGLMFALLIWFIVMRRRSRSQEGRQLF